jgi:predicted nucleic acid-binding protein
MRVMVDTNVIISAILNEDSLSDTVLNEVCENHELILCDYIISECYDVAKRRFPMKIQVLDKLFAKLRFELTAKVARGKWRVYEVGISYYGRSYKEGKKINWKDGFRAMYVILKYGIFKRK